MADHRTRRQKLQAMADDPGASQGERDNARSILAKMKPEPEHAFTGLRGILNGYDPARGRDRTVETCPHGVAIAEGGRRCHICNPYRPPTGTEASGAGARARWSHDDWEQYDFYQRAGDRLREELERMRRSETLRRAGFRTPDDPGFEEFTYAASRFADEINRARARDPLDTDAERLVDDYMAGKISTNEFRRRMWLKEE